jgi:hypothetical protein
MPDSIVFVHETLLYSHHNLSRKLLQTLNIKRISLLNVVKDDLDVKMFLRPKSYKVFS